MAAVLALQTYGATFETEWVLSTSFFLLYLKSVGAGSERETRKKASMCLPLRYLVCPPPVCASCIPLIPPPACLSATCPQMFRANVALQTFGYQRISFQREVQPIEGGRVAVGLPAGVRPRALVVGGEHQKRAVPGYRSGQVGRFEDLVANG